MWMIILNLIKNPKILGIIAGVIIITYYQLSIWSLENEIEKSNIKIEKLKMNIDIARSNTKVAVSVNKKNKDTMSECKKDVKNLDESYARILKSKDETIYKLRLTISDLKTPIEYPNTIIYEECKFEIKTKDDNDEKTNNTFNNLLNIGR